MNNKTLKNTQNNIKENSIILFKEKQIRRTWHNKQWWFSVSDICFALTDSIDAKAYWRKLKQRLKDEGSQVVTNCHELKLISSDGKKYLTDCANTKGIFRIIQSIPSPKAEPFKQWLAKIGYERIQEIEDPELAQIRMKSLYEQKGYPQDWIDKRLRGIAVRQNLKAPPASGKSRALMFLAKVFSTPHGSKIATTVAILSPALPHGES